MISSELTIGRRIGVVLEPGDDIIPGSRQQASGCSSAGFDWHLGSASTTGAAEACE